MRHIFIINPASGKKGQTKALEQHITQASRKTQIPVELYETTGVGDGEVYTRDLCSKHPREQFRLYACGGDGALNEVINGCFGFENVEVGCVPMGTGNDYVRNYTDRVGDFLDIESQLTGQAVRSDLIRYTGRVNGAMQEKYCVNMFNIGFDCNVVDETNRVKKWPFISGSLAYFLSVFIVLIKKKGADLKVEYQDGSLFDGQVLLTSIANGCYCGGGIKGLPRALTADSLMDVSLIHSVSRMTCLQLFPKYIKGTHLEDKRVEHIIDYQQCTNLTITPNGPEMRLCIDGEVAVAEKIRFEIAPKAINFIVPAGVAGREGA